jgi:hypothetical protein
VTDANETGTEMGTHLDATKTLPGEMTQMTNRVNDDELEVLTILPGGGIGVAAEKTIKRIRSEHICTVSVP